MSNFLRCYWRVLTGHRDPFGIGELESIMAQSEFWQNRCQEALARAESHLQINDIEGYIRHLQQYVVARNRFDREVSDRLETLK